MLDKSSVTLNALSLCCFLLLSKQVVSVSRLQGAGKSDRK